MATWIDAEGAIALTTAAILYALSWYAVRKRSRTTKLVARSVLLAIFFTPALWVAILGGDGQFASARSAVIVAATPATAGQKQASKRAPAPTAPADDQNPATLPAKTPSLSAGAPEKSQEKWHVVRVFYGTDRAQLGTEKRIIYGSSRASRLELGIVDVTVPKLHEVPGIERPWVVRLPFTTVSIFEQSEDPEKHFTVRDIKALSQDAFLALVRARLQTAKEFADRAVVFIHGYNTDFDFAVYRTAQMAYDLKFDGAPFIYSWPSSHGVTGYVYDRDSAEQTEPYLKAFLDLVIHETGAKKITLIAHSMGNRPLMRVLRQIEPTLPDSVKIDQVILAAPDVDRDVFEQLARGIVREDRGVTLYASKNDRAMAAARVVAGGVPRAGDVPADGPVVVPGIDTIDISSTSTDALVLNHSLYAQSKVLIADIAAIIRTGERPPEKRLPALQRVQTLKGEYWRHP